MANNLSNTKIELRDYQLDATKNIKKIFASNSHNRFAGVILPTGGGKSFVSIEQILSFNNPNYNNDDLSFSNSFVNKDINKRVINNSSMLYLAPTNEILSQVKMHIIRNVLFKIPNLENMTVDEINNLMENNFQELNFKGINFNSKDQVLNTDKAKEKVNAILRQLTPKQVNELVKNAFPNLEFKCYAGVKGDNENKNEDVTDKDILGADLIIVDEAHRLGASKWGPNFSKNLKINSSSKVLAITATPERTDKMRKNMMAGIAKMVYPNETVTQEEYMAKEIYLLDAIKSGIVNAPDIIECDASLANFYGYKNLVFKYENVVEGKEKEKLGKILDKMEEIIGFSPRNMTTDEIEKINEEKIKEIISNNIPNINGKYIVFIEDNREKNGVKLSNEEFFQKQIDLIKKRFEGVLDENGQPVKVNVSFLTSNTSIKVDKNGYPVTENGEGKRIDNSQTLKNFEDASNSSGGIKLLLSNKMLDEGVHVENIDGAIMLNRINDRTRYLQQSGRCISSLDPNKSFEQQKKTQIIDITGNTFNQLTNYIDNKDSSRYDLDLILEIDRWMSKNNKGEFPNINKQIPKDASNKEKIQIEKEIRYAIGLKRIKMKYSMYRNNSNIPLDIEENVNSIISNADKMKVWDYPILEREGEPTEEELTGNGFLEKLTPKQKIFIELYNSAIEKSRPKIAEDERVSKLLHVLKVLKSFDATIQFPQGIQLSEKNKIKSEDAVSYKLEDFLKEKFTKEMAKHVLVELGNTSTMEANSKNGVIRQGDNYDLGEEISYVRGKFWTSQHDYIKTGISLFENYSLSDLVNLGLIENGMKDLIKINEISRIATKEWQIISESKKDEIPKELYEYFCDKHGRWDKNFGRFEKLNVGLLSKFEKCSLINGQEFFDGYDRDGYDKYGYNEKGYNRLGFNRYNINEVTGEKYDERGFYYDDKTDTWVNKETNGEYDLLGYNIYGYNKDGFERPKGNKKNKYILPKWHNKNKDGTYDTHGYTMKPAMNVGETSHDAHGFTGKSKTNNEYRSFDGKNKTDPNGFYSNGSTRKETVKNPLTIDDYYNEDGVDIDGFNSEGFKKIEVDGKTKFIHRDTSCEYTKDGCIWRAEVGKKVKQKDLHISREFIKLMLEKDISPSNAVIIMEKEYGIPSVFIKKCINVGMQLQKKYCLDVFSIKEEEEKEISNNFKIDERKNLLETYINSHMYPLERRKQLDEFIELTPSLREYYIKDSEEIIKMISPRIETKDSIKKAKTNNIEMEDR